MVSDPVKPSSRKVSAARRPASEAPTTTMRPWRRRTSTSVSADMRLHTLRRLIGVVDKDGLHRAGRRSLFHPVTLCLVEARGEQQRFAAVQSEDVRGEKDA